MKLSTALGQVEQRRCTDSQESVRIETLIAIIEEHISPPGCTDSQESVRIETWRLSADRRTRLRCTDSQESVRIETGTIVSALLVAGVAPTPRSR